MKKVLFVGDYVIKTGFGRCNKELIKAFLTSENRFATHREPAWDVHSLAINATGDACPEQRYVKIYPAALNGDDFGVNRIAGLVKFCQPDLIILHNDSWLVEMYLQALKQANLLGQCPIIGYCPPDAENQATAFMLNDGLDLLLSPTNFGVEQLRAGGYTGPAAKLPYGVDLDYFTPGDRREARVNLGYPEHLLDAFVIGRADRNATRKRYDLTLEYFASWWHMNGKPSDVYLHFHCQPAEHIGWNLPQLSKFYGIEDRIIFTDRKMTPRTLKSDDQLRDVYRAWNLHWSTAAGEGHGLVAHESAACGIAQLLGDYGASGEIFAKGGILVPAEGRMAHTGGVNTVGWIPDRFKTFEALEELYGSPLNRSRLQAAADAARNDARQDCYHWDTIRSQFLDHCEAVMRTFVKKEQEAA
jgi:hypothetical protein